MTGLHDLDHMFPAGFDEATERELRLLFAAAQAPGQSDELEAEASVVAMMADIVRGQAATSHASQRRARLRVVASRGAAVALVTGFAVVSTSVAAAAGILPRPMQSAFERAARVAGWHVFDHDDATGAVHADPVPTSIVAITAEPDATVRTTEPPAVVAHLDTDVTALCHRWALSTRSGVALEDDVKRALIAVAERTGGTVDRMCGPALLTPSDASPTADASPTQPPEVPSSVSPIDDTGAPTADPAPPSTSDGDPQATPTLPPQANGDGPRPADEPSPADDGTDASTNGTPNANANPNATANANGNGNGNAEANANANAHGGNPNANGNANGNGNDRGNGDG